MVVFAVERGAASQFLECSGRERLSGDGRRRGRFGSGAAESSATVNAAGGDAHRFCDRFGLLTLVERGHHLSAIDLMTSGLEAGSGEQQRQHQERKQASPYQESDFHRRSP
jgi:glycine/D-amino acid oxidase-like deaminating enzyme